MKNVSLFLIFIFSISFQVYSQKSTDSIILFSDLRYHSDFEKEALYNFVKHKKDTFKLFLAIDESIPAEIVNSDYKTYSEIFEILNQKNIQSKNLNRKIKIAYSTVHDRFLKKYIDNEFFPAIFQSGNYNCVTASILYAMVFNKLEIPYKIMASANHVYLVANPGSNSIVVETTNPNFELAIFNGEFKQQYVNYLRNSKLISEAEYKNKSVEEIFEEKFKEVNEAEFNNLIGFQYYNKALMKLQNQDIEEALKLIQKAYYFNPDQQVKMLLFTTLLYEIEKCTFDKVPDIDYLAQFSRFENADINNIVAIFKNVISYYLQFKSKESYCDSLYQRLITQIPDKKLSDEISFNYNLMMGYHFMQSDKVEKYMAGALEIKSDYVDAYVILESYLSRKIYRIQSSSALLDTINQLEKRYPFEGMRPIINEFKLIADLKIANDLYGDKKIKEGDKYLQEFETKCALPLDAESNQVLMHWIENTYRTIAIYYFYQGNKQRAKEYIARGLKYVPNSKFLESAVY